MGCRCIKPHRPHNVLPEEQGPEVQDVLDVVLPAEQGLEVQDFSEAELPEEQGLEVQDFLNAVKDINGLDVFSRFRDAPPTVRADRDCALAAMNKWGTALHYAANYLKADKEVVLAAVAQNGEALYDAATDLKDDKDVVLAAVTQSGKVLEYASDSLKQDPQVVMVASASYKDAKKYLDQSANHWSNRNMVLSVVTRKGEALKFAADNLRADKDVVLAAVAQCGPSLKYAKKPLNQDPDCLKASGLWDQSPIVYCEIEKAILSVKFSLAETSSQYATDFVLELKKDPYLMYFQTYNPNAWEKDACDPTFTNIDWPCKGVLKSRGTLESCTLNDDKNLKMDKDGKKIPGDQSCWRFAFRFHLEECKASQGFMIQVEERKGLGDGQKIETELAKLVGLKVFRTYTNDDVVANHSGKHSYNGMNAISKAIKEWYDDGCTNKDMENVFIGDENAATRMPHKYGYTKRPKHGEF